MGYIRTALTLFVAEISFLKFFGDPITTVIGWLFNSLGVVTVSLGWISYYKRRKIIGYVYENKFKIESQDEDPQDRAVI